MTSKTLSRIWKPAWTLSLAAVVFVLCLFPYRALLNYHEQTHLFRWNSYYIREQWGALEGIWEYLLYRMAGSRRDGPDCR